MSILTAKTLLSERLAHALGMNSQAYDASKALWEDVIGFPNPKNLDKEVAGYIPTEISIWDKDFILIDEISRATVQMQNKWLEVIRIMDKNIETLKYIFSAMNPLGYAGAVPLDEALVARFAIFAKMPKIDEMDKEDIIKITNHISSSNLSMIDDNRFEIKEKTKSKLENKRWWIYN